MGCSFSSQTAGEDRPEAKPGEKTEEELFEACNHNGTIVEGSKPVTEQSVLITPHDPAEAICRDLAELPAEAQFGEADPTSEPTPAPEPTSTSEPVLETEPVTELNQSPTSDSSGIKEEESNSTSGN